MAPKRPRCQLDEKTETACRSPAQLIGTCDLCKKRYCSKHRLYEDHKCPGLEDVCSLGPLFFPSSTPPNRDETEWWKVGLSGLLAPDDWDLEMEMVF